MHIPRTMKGMVMEKVSKSVLTLLKTKGGDGGARKLTPTRRGKGHEHGRCTSKELEA